MYWLMGIWLKGLDDLPYCHCCIICPDIFLKWSFTSGEAVVYFHINTYSPMSSTSIWFLWGIQFCKKEELIGLCRCWYIWHQSKVMLQKFKIFKLVLLIDTDRRQKPDKETWPSCPLLFTAGISLGWRMQLKGYHNDNLNTNHTEKHIDTQERNHGQGWL